MVVHFELVTDLSTASFLNAIRRFTRRCINLYSDYSITFVGTNNQSELKEFLVKTLIQLRLKYENT